MFSAPGMAAAARVAWASRLALSRPATALPILSTCPPSRFLGTAPTRCLSLLRTPTRHNHAAPALPLGGVRGPLVVCRGARGLRKPSAEPVREVVQTVQEAERPSFDHLLDSVVKIYAVTVSPNYIQPWTMKPQKESTGSGFAIAGRRLLTNAHVVANQSSVMVRKHGSSKKYPAQVAHVGHECDLAILHVPDDTFWDDLPYLEFGELPELQDRIVVIGYPAGGDTVSLSAGVVSRVELQQYAHGASHLLAIQIDAAINPGNSGGPAIRGEKVVGVAFQHLPGAENIGYVIPIPIIAHFLQDIARHGKYTGFCRFGFFAQALENMGLRRYLGIPQEKEGGILVTRTLPLHHAHEVLRKDDVIFSIDNVSLASDGTINFRHRERITFDYLLINKYLGDRVALQIWRDRQPQEVRLRVSPVKPLVAINEYDRTPSYFIHAGLTFIPLVQPYLHEWGDDWFNTSPRKLSLKAQHGVAEFEDQQIVVLSMVLVDEINYEFQSMTQVQVLRFNNEAVRNLRHLKEMVLSCRDDFLRFDLDTDLVICMLTQAAREANHRILRRHRIASAFSEDLRAASDPPMEPQQLYGTLTVGC
eukprot:comp23888_c0_seq1/m.41949 comp23888_c0_seq1/g.41949  ORF comp23888_c0_seq1/g.41949 comp23888_c0_seq1/m.41949 type:complete len:589 (-) comp23888_c0_seq1:319-2085(-)